MTREDFESWVENPATQWVFRAVLNASRLQKEEWERASWDEGKADQLLLTELRTRADAYLGIAETPYERFCELNGENLDGRDSSD
jgi:hypothetical protein